MLEYFSKRQSIIRDTNAAEKHRRPLPIPHRMIKSKGLRSSRVGKFIATSLSPPPPDSKKL